ncbi:transglutaminase family protein [Pelagerythrobacter marinus]|uniref:transglutaminase family protein n=1 Tax=Pelagerythrobacter marinus TaxID=538382 RepID=UPI002AC95A0A|nr:transglutaminase family protein [Pelagerythrobacter marinus]WPZ07616.1 transglutaminase family protein [Pelagerythrobacter marinus]
MLLTIRHTTIYRYSKPVVLLPHRLMLTPRSSHHLNLRSTRVSTSPAADIEWSQDVYGNVIATAVFAEPGDELTVSGDMVVDQGAPAWPVFKVAPHAHSFPFGYSETARSALGELLEPEYDDPAGQLDAWVRSIVAGEPTDTLSLLQDLSNAVRILAAYVKRDDEGTQSPLETLGAETGSCRDLATLFIDAARHLGVGARAVSGYLYDHVPADAADEGQHGATHAWAEVYLPCAGWIAFDPTNGRMGEAQLVPVATARSITQIRPVEGTFVGAPEDFLSLEVDVVVSNGGAI